MQLSLTKWIPFLILHIFFINGYTQNTLSVKKGIVTDSLVVTSTGNNFSIYLPKNFDINKSWPILFGFDSSGKTGRIAQLYKPAAEKLGYIVAVSAIKENQPAKERVEYASFFIDYIQTLFPIQKGRIYVSGIGNDAKLAGILPVLLNDTIFGVIAIEDSFDFNLDMKIKKNFSYIGIVNSENYKYRMLLNIKKYLNRKAIPADVYVYNNNKSKLPTPKYINKALTSFTLQAMQKGRMPKDSIWVKNVYEEDLKQVDTYLSKKEFISAFDEVKRMQTKYRLFFDTNHLKENQKSIKQLKAYKRERRLKTQYLNKENYLRSFYFYAIDEDVQTENYENLGWWTFEASKLDTLIVKKEHYEQRMGYRMKGYLGRLVEKYKTDQLTEVKGNNLEKKFFLYILSTIVNKKDYESYKKIISLSAQDQDNKTALFYLEKMLQNGFQDIESLYTIEGTMALKISKEYNKLIEKYLGRSKYFFSK